MAAFRYSDNYEPPGKGGGGGEKNRRVEGGELLHLTGYPEVGGK
jgi:hypothetical protein